MKQVLQIFRKDVRSRWPELLLVLVCLIAYGHYEISTWPGDPASGFSRIGSLYLTSTLSQFTTFLLPLSWMLLIARVVQDESLVGDRQFWVTRPYDWKKLLSSKVLFLIVFVNLPLLVLQTYLLERAGFSPSSNFLALLPTHVGLLLGIVLPAVALAAVTATLGQYLLAIVAVLLSLIGIAFVYDKIPNSHFSGPSETLEFYTVLGVLIAVVLIQYAARRSTLSRLLLVGGTVFVALVVVIFPYTLVVKSEYPLQASSQPQLTWTLNPPGNSRVDYEDDPDTVEYQLPINAVGVSESEFLQVDGFRVTLKSLTGAQWESHWQSSHSKLYTQGANFTLNIRVKRGLAKTFANTATNIHVSLLLSHYRTRNSRTFVVPSGEFRSPEFGICAGEAGYSRSLRCRVPVTTTQSLIVAGDLSKSTCPLRKDETQPPEGTFEFDWLTNDSEFGPALSSIRVYSVSLWNFQTAEKSFKEPGICPGTQLIVSEPRLEGREQVQFSLNGVDLNSYQAQPFRLTR